MYYCINWQKKAYMFDLEIEFENVFCPRLHDSYGTDWGRSIKMATDNILSICVVNLKFKGPTFPLPAIAVQSKGQTF